MYTHEVYIGTPKPKEIASYETLTFPFDSNVWTFTLAVVIIELMILITTQKLWCDASGVPVTLNSIYEG